METDEKKVLCTAVGKRVRRCRESQNMTKEQLAEAVGISTQYVSDIEQGRKCMSMSIFVDFGRIFQISLDQLGKGEAKHEPQIERLVEHLMEMAPVEREMTADLIYRAAGLIEACGREY